MQVVQPHRGLRIRLHALVQGLGEDADAMTWLEITHAVVVQADL
jgi:hypothetical protein